MPRPKITIATRNLILRLARKSTHLGVRGIARVLQQKHNITVSKSSIASILKKKSLRDTRGRKQAILEHRLQPNRQCGLLLLRCLDSHIGLIDHVAQELKAVMPQLGAETLKKILIFKTFSAFTAQKLSAQDAARDLLRLAGLNRLNQRLERIFTNAIETRRPAISLQAVREGVNLISTIKFYFGNKSIGFTDATMSTFWDDICRFERFYFPLQGVLVRLEQMLKDRVLIIGYTKSFDYLSRLTFDFIKGIQSGIESIELLDKNGSVVRRMKLSHQKIVLVFGYSPMLVTQGMVVFSGAQRLRKISAERGFEFYASSALSRCSQPPGAAPQKQTHRPADELFLSATMVKEQFTGPFQWGILATASNRTRKLTPYLRKYLYMWRYISDDFFKDMDAIQKAVFDHEKKRTALSTMLPARLCLSTVQDCARIGQILSILFKEVVFGWEPKAQSGTFRLGKDAVCISLPGAPFQVKKHFNRSGFTFAKKLAVLV